MAIAVTLKEAQQINNQVILWAGRVVFYHIGEDPLGVVGDRVFEEINRIVASEGVT